MPVTQLLACHPLMECVTLWHTKQQALSDCQLKQQNPPCLLEHETCCECKLSHAALLIDGVTHGTMQACKSNKQDRLAVHQPYMRHSSQPEMIATLCCCIKTLHSTLFSCQLIVSCRMESQQHKAKKEERHMHPTHTHVESSGPAIYTATTLYWTSSKTLSLLTTRVSHEGSTSTLPVDD
jgi:hypothetical protein